MLPDSFLYRHRAMTYCTLDGSEISQKKSLESVCHGLVDTIFNRSTCL